MTRRPIATLVIALLLAAASLLAVFRLRIDTSLTSLFDKHDPAAAALDRVLNHFRAVEELIVFAQADDAQPEKLRAFAQRLETAVGSISYASALSDGVIWRADPQFRRFAEEILVPNGLFYLDDASFDAAQKRLTLDEMKQQIRRNETLISTPGPAADALSKVILQDPLRLHEFVIERVTAGRAFKTYENGDAFISPDGRSILIRVRGRRPVSDLEFSKEFTAIIGEIAARQNRDNFRLDFSGGYAIAAASERAIRGDMISNVIWSIIGLQLLFVVAFRRPVRSFLLAFLPVAVGLLYGFGAYALISNSLTPMTAVIGGTLAGMSIDYAIEFLTYYHAKRAAGLSAIDAAVAARRSCSGAMLAAWATSVVGFVAIGTSNVKALRDFSILGSLGLTGAFLAALLILPALLIVFDRKRAAATAPAGRIPVQAMLRRVIRRPRAGAILTAVTLLAAIVVLLAPGEILPLETDLTVMHPRPNPALDAQSRIANAFGTSPGALVIHLSAKNDDELLRLAHSVDGRLRDPRCRDAGVTAAFGLGSVLPDPSVAPARIANTGAALADRVVADFRAAVADSIFDAKAYEPYEQFLRRLLTATRAPAIADLRKYPSIAETILPATADAKTHATAKTTPEAITLVFTKDAGAQRESRDATVTAIRAALADLPGATLTGLSVLNYDTEITVRRELPRVLIVSGVLVMIYMLAHYRNLVDCTLATLPAIFGIVCLLAYMRITGQRLNMINLVAFPLLIGIDVDYGIFVVSAARRGRRRRRAARVERRSDRGKARPSQLRRHPLRGDHVHRLRHAGFHVGPRRPLARRRRRGRRRDLRGRDLPARRADAGLADAPRGAEGGSGRMIATAAAILAPVSGVVVARLIYATVAPACSFWGRVISRAPAGSRRVALTFDDGPTPGATDVILDALRDAGVPASFFVIGANVRKHPDLLRRIHDEGHLVGNHSQNHSHYGICRNTRYWLREMIETDDAIEQVIGVRPAIYRPPCGMKTWHTFSAMRRTGHTMVNWSRRAVDGLPTTPQRIMRRFEQIADGEILLLHDGVEPNTAYADRAATIAVLPMLLEQLRQQNLTPVRLDELLGVAAYQSAGAAGELVAAAAAGAAR